MTITFTRYMVRYEDGLWASKSKYFPVEEASKAQVYFKKGDAENRARRGRRSKGRQLAGVVIPVACTVKVS